MFENLGKGLDAMLNKGKAIELLEKEIDRLNTRVQDLLECNNAYLQRARDAEAKLRKEYDRFSRPVL